MAELFEYYLAGGKMRMGKRELALEVLRKDSILRILLGYDSGRLNSMLAKASIGEQGGDEVMVDFSGRNKLKLGGEPTAMLNQLKQRYGGNVGGILNFVQIYTTFDRTSYWKADLDTEPVVMQLVAEYR